MLLIYSAFYFPPSPLFAVMFLIKTEKKPFFPTFYLPQLKVLNNFMKFHTTKLF